MAAEEYEPSVLNVWGRQRVFVSKELYEEAARFQEQLKFWMENPDKRPPRPRPLWQENEYNRDDRGTTLEVTHNGRYIIKDAYGDADISLDPEKAIGLAVAILKDAKERFPNPTQ